jgi:hypothetical protein
MSAISAGGGVYDGEKITTDSELIINTVATNESKIVVKALEDLPPPDENDEIVLDKNNGFSRWEFTAFITLPDNVTIFRKGVNIVGLNEEAGLKANAAGKALFRDVEGLPESIENMKLSNTGLNGSIFNSKMTSVILDNELTVKDCQIIECGFIGTVTGWGLTLIKDVRIFQATNGGFLFGDLSFPPPLKIKMDNVLFRDAPNPSGDAITVNASFGAGPYTIESIDITNCDLYSEVGYNTINVISPSNIQHLNIDTSTRFLGTGKPLNGIARNSEGVRVGRDSHWAIYTDTNLGGFPLTIPHGVWTKVTNNKGVIQKDLPYNITNLWDGVANKIDCSQLDIGTLLNVSIIANIESDKIQSAVESRLFGLDTAATVVNGKSEFMNAQNTKYMAGFYFDLPIETQDQITNGFEIQLNATDPNNSVLIIDFTQIVIKVV